MSEAYKIAKKIHDQFAEPFLEIQKKNRLHKSYSKKVVYFVDGEKEIEVTIPEINGKVKCPNCSSCDSWKDVDYDWEGDRKYIQYRCCGYMEINSDFADTRCDHYVIIFLDENNEPIWE